MIITKLASGKAFSLYAIVINNNCLVQDYIDSLEPKMQKQLFALFQLVIENGPPNDKRKFNPIGDKIYELKTGTVFEFYVFMEAPYCKNRLY